MECMVFLFAYLWNGLEMDAPSSALNGKIHCFSRNCCCCWAMNLLFFFCEDENQTDHGLYMSIIHTHSASWWPWEPKDMQWYIPAHGGLLALSRSEFPIYIIDASELKPLEQQSWPRNSSIVFCSILNILFECCVTFLFGSVSQACS